MKWLILLLFLPMLSAHPLDDKAEMQLQVRITTGDKLELHFEFRYKDAVAVATELRSRLDLDSDGQFNDGEIQQRFLAHADETLLGLTISCNEETIFANYDIAKFRFWDLKNPDSPVNIDTAGFGYGLLFTAKVDTSADIRITFSGTQTVVNIPARQMLAFDNRTQPPVKLDVEYSDDLAVFPWMLFSAKSQEQPTGKEPEPALVEVPEVSQQADKQPVQEKPWYVYVLLLVFCGAGLLSMIKAVRLRKPKYLAYGTLFWIVSLAVFWGSV